MGKAQAAGQGAQWGGFYFISAIGVLIYFLNEANGAGEVFLAFLQALVWPAIMFYRIFQVLNVAG